MILPFLPMTQKPPNPPAKKAKKPNALSYVLLVLLGISLYSFVRLKGLLHAYDNEDPPKTAVESSLNDFLGKSDLKRSASSEQSYSIMPPSAVEDPVPNPELVNGYDSFSACLLVMDDNHRLIECK